MQVSLQALKAFEVAARRGSFKLAAEELSLTPTAISHHISNLESRLNVSLFYRQGRQISLTETGLTLAKATSDGFRRIDTALEEILKAGSRIRVTTTSSLAAMVLIPSQTEFEQANPTISMEILTGESVDSQSYVIPIRLGDVSGVEEADIIRTESFNAFCAYGVTPSLEANEPITLFTTQWKNKTLPNPPLADWLALNGLDNATIKLKKFDQELFGIQQAMAGNGLVFCSTTLSSRLVKSNLLQPLNTRSVKSDLCYYVPNKARFETNSAVTFLRWIDDVLSH